MGNYSEIYNYLENNGWLYKHHNNGLGDYFECNNDLNIDIRLSNYIVNWRTKQQHTVTNIELYHQHNSFNIHNKRAFKIIENATLKDVIKLFRVQKIKTITDNIKNEG